MQGNKTLPPDRKIYGKINTCPGNLNSGFSAGFVCGSEISFSFCSFLKHLRFYINNSVCINIKGGNCFFETSLAELWPKKHQRCGTVFLEIQKSGQINLLL